MFIKLKPAHLKQYTAPQAASFFGAVKKVIDNAGYAQLGIKEADYQAFCLNYNKLSDAVNATQGSDKTTQINAYDEERDNQFRFIRNILANLKYSTDKELAGLYETANTKILKVYPSNIANEPKQEETAHIIGFAIDIRKYFGEHLNKLGIATALTALETANGNFLATFLDRSNELANQVEKATETYRAELEKIYARMELTINYNASLTDATTEKEIELCSTCTEAMGIMNQYIDELWQSIKLSKALKKEDKTNSNGTSTKPSSGGNTKPSGGTSGGGSTSSGSDDIL